MQKSKKVLVSVFIPTFNQEEFIVDALTSVFDQLVDFKMDTVVVDDASTDATFAVSQEFSKQSPFPISIIRNPENIFSQGKSPLLTSLKLLNGKYVARLDGDDYWSNPTKLQRQVELLEKFKNINIATTLMEQLDNDSGSLTKIHNTFSPSNFSEVIINTDELVKSNFIGNSTALFRKKFLKDLPDSWLGLAVRDYALWGYIAARGGVALIPEIMAVHRIHINNSWMNLSTEQRKIDEFHARFWIYENVRDQALKDLWKKQLLLIHEHEINH